MGSNSNLLLSTDRYVPGYLILHSYSTSKPTLKESVKAVVEMLNHIVKIYIK